MIRASESPTAAQRTPPMWIGPVGLAETNSRLIDSPAMDSPRPNAAPASTIERASSPAAVVSSRMLRNPGPATSTSPTPTTSPRRWASSAANSRGATRAFLPSCIAMLDDQSPCSRWRGRSRCTAAGMSATSRANVPSATAASRAERMASERLAGVTLAGYLVLGADRAVAVRPVPVAPGATIRRRAVRTGGEAAPPPARSHGPQEPAGARGGRDGAKRAQEEEDTWDDSPSRTDRPGRRAAPGQDH